MRTRVPEYTCVITDPPQPQLLSSYTWSLELSGTPEELADDKLEAFLAGELEAFLIREIEAFFSDQIHEGGSNG